MSERQYLLYHSVFATQIEFKKTFMFKAIDINAQTFEINISHLQKLHVSLPRLVLNKESVSNATARSCG